MKVRLANKPWQRHEKNKLFKTESSELYNFICVCTDSWEGLIFDLTGDPTSFEVKPFSQQHPAIGSVVNSCTRHACNPGRPSQIM